MFTSSNNKKKKTCCVCGKKVHKDVIALHYKIFDLEEIESFYCLTCLAKFLDCDEESLIAAIEAYKEQGCQHFI